MGGPSTMLNMSACSRAFLSARRCSVLYKSGVTALASAPMRAASQRTGLRAVAPRTFATASSESHDDFKSQSNVQPPSDINERIQEDIDADDVVVYMKGIPTAPQCGFSNAVVKIMEAQGVSDYAAYNVLEDPELRE